MRAKWYLVLLGTVAATNKSFGQELVNEIFHVPDLGDICENLNQANGIDEICKEQLGVICGNLTLFMTMLDASSKFPFTGLDYASKIDLGNFDQCMIIDHSYKGGRISGEYCREGLIVFDHFNSTPLDGWKYYRLSVCRPDGCCASDYNEIVNNSKNFSFLDSRCQIVERRKTFTTSDIVTLAIFTVVIGLIMLSTFYDTIIYRNLGNPHPLLVTFSILSNGRRLLHISKHSSKEQIETFNGLRAIGMMWIVAAHGFLSWEKVPVVNRWEVKINWTEYLYAGYITSAPLAVDTFFYMSGFLVAFRYLKSKVKSLKSQVLAVPCMYLQRYLRLTPALLMTYLMIISFFKHLGSGPLWVTIESFGKICEENWWSTFLYIQNYHNYDKVCLPPTWFLSAIMQLFLLSPLVLIPLALTLKKPNGFKKSMKMLLILNVFCTFVPMAHKLLVTDYQNEYDTQTRLIDYFIGMTLAVAMREKIDKPFLYTVKESYRRVINFITWALTLLAMLSIVICHQLIEIHNNYKVQAISYSLIRPAWCICLSWIVYSCYHGYGGLVNWILCRPIFQILGRLTYCIYLLHQSVIDYNVATTRAPWYFTDYHAFYLFCGHYLVSVIIAIFWTLAFESPFIALEKYLVGRENETERDGSTRQIIYDEDAPQKNFTNNRNMENSSSNNMKVEELYKKNKEID